MRTMFASRAWLRIVRIMTVEGGASCLKVDLTGPLNHRMIAKWTIQGASFYGRVVARTFGNVEWYCIIRGLEAWISIGAPFPFPPPTRALPQTREPVPTRPPPGPKARPPAGPEVAPQPPSGIVAPFAVTRVCPPVSTVPFALSPPYQLVATHGMQIPV